MDRSRCTTILSRLLVMVLWVAIACKKEDKKSTLPQITLQSIAPLSVKEFQDSLEIVIRYKDEDGDLGSADPESKNLFITDNRMGLRYEYRIQQLAPTGAMVSIEGDVKVVLNTLAILDTAAITETATFSIFVKDRSGNASNTLVSPAVTITR